MAPIKLKGFPGVKRQRDEHLAGCLALRKAPALDVSADTVVTSIIPFQLQFLEKLLCCPPLPLWNHFVTFKPLIQPLNVGPQLWHRLLVSNVSECRFLTADHLSDRIPGKVQILRRLPQ